MTTHTDLDARVERARQRAVVVYSDERVIVTWLGAITTRSDGGRHMFETRDAQTGELLRTQLNVLEPDVRRNDAFEHALETQATLVYERDALHYYLVGDIDGNGYTQFLVVEEGSDARVLTFATRDEIVSDADAVQQCAQRHEHIHRSWTRKQRAESAAS